MSTIIIVLVIIGIFGLIFRDKGDSALDTLGSGAKGCLWIVIILIILALILSQNNFHF